MQVKSEADAKLFINKEELAINAGDKRKRYGYARFSSTLGRCFDFTLGLILLILASPVFLIIAAAIKLNDGGPVFYKQLRMGYQKKLFTIYKFRTLTPDADKVIGDEVLDIKHKVATPYGNFLRNTRLDELPQLINVLKGEMSLVGPRPIVENEIKKYGEYFDYFTAVKPGITGLWQVSGRNDIDYDERVHLDVWYTRNWSIELDIQILLQTISVVLLRKGSY